MPWSDCGEDILDRQMRLEPSMHNFVALDSKSCTTTKLVEFLVFLISSKLNTITSYSTRESSLEDIY